jgi:hypothetical protein
MFLAMRIDVLAPNDVFDLGLAAVLDAFQTANELIAVTKKAISRFDVRIVGVRRSVNTSLGLRVPVHAAGKRPPDCVAVEDGRRFGVSDIGLQGVRTSAHGLL